MKKLLICLVTLSSLSTFASNERNSSEFFHQPEVGKMALRPGLTLGYDHLEQRRNTNGNRVSRNVISYFLDLEFQYTLSDFLTLGATTSYGIRVNDFITWQSPVTYSEQGFRDFDFDARGRATVNKDLDVIYGLKYIWSPSDLIIEDKYDRNYFSGGDSLSGHLGVIYKLNELKLGFFYERDIFADDKSVDDRENNIKYTLEVEESQSYGFTGEFTAQKLITLGGKLEFVKDAEFAGYNEIDYWQFEGLFNFSPAEQFDLFATYSFGRITTSDVPGFSISDSRVNAFKLNARVTF